MKILVPYLAFNYTSRRYYRAWRNVTTSQRKSSTMTSFTNKQSNYYSTLNYKPKVVPSTYGRYTYYPRYIADNYNKVPHYCPKPPYTLISYLLAFPTRNKRAFIALASWPGSGNTWVRHLLERGSGIATGNVYSPDLALVPRFYGENIRDGRRVIAVKTHYPCAFCFGFNQSSENVLYKTVNMTGILVSSHSSIEIIRNPFEAIVSYFNFIFTDQNHTGRVPLDMFDTQIFEKFVVVKLKSWILHTRYYLSKKISPRDIIRLEPQLKQSNAFFTSRLTGFNNLWLDYKNKPVFPLFYDDLKNNTYQAMLPVFKFIKRLADENDELMSKLDPATAANCSVVFTL